MSTALSQQAGTHPTSDELDTLRAALDERLAALEAGLANPDDCESLENLILDLAHVATEEAEAATRRAILDAQLNASHQVSASLSDAQSLQTSLDAERAAGLVLHRDLGKARLAFNAERQTTAALNLDVERARLALDTERMATAALRREIHDAGELIAATEAARQADTDALATRQQELQATQVDATTALAVHQRELEAVQEDAVAVLATHQQELQAAREHAATALAAHQRELRTARDDEAARAADLEAVRARADALELSHADLRQALSDAETSVDAARRDRDAAIAQLDAVRQSAGEDQANETARYDDLREKTERRILDLELELIRGNLTPVEDDIELAVDPEMAAGPITKAAPSKLQPSPALHSPPRGAERQAFREALGVQLDGEAALIVDLSTSGAQVLSQTALKPARMIKMLLPSAESPVLCKGKIVWARLEPPSPGKTYRYRAGVFFTAIDASALQTFMTRHGGGSARES